MVDTMVAELAIKIIAWIMMILFILVDFLILAITFDHGVFKRWQRWTIRVACFASIIVIIYSASLLLTI